MSSQLTDYFEVRNGYAFTSAEQLSEFESDTIEILKQGHIEIGGGLRKDPKKSYVRMSSKLERFMLERGDIVMAMTDMKDNVVILGVPALVDSSNKYVLNQRVAWLKPREKTVTKFFYYQMLTTEFLEELRSKANSGVQVNLSVSNIKEMKFWTPPLPEQRAIAEVLSSLDDKIDLLHRNNKTLEEMAEALFRQWFVVEAKEEWEVKKLDDILTTVGGTTPSTTNPEFWDGNICWTSPRDITTLSGIYLFDTERKITEKGLSKISSGLLPKGSLLMSSRAPVGVLAFAEVPVAINQGYIAILDNKGFDKLFIYLWLKHNMEYVHSFSNGSTFMEISKSAFKSLEIVLPPLSIVKSFIDNIKPLFDKIKHNELTIKTLSRSRDILLPKLMSGQVRVKDL